MDENEKAIDSGPMDKWCVRKRCSFNGEVTNTDVVCPECGGDLFRMSELVRIARRAAELGYVKPRKSITDSYSSWYGYKPVVEPAPAK